ncbi:hypothetical protein FOZ63_007256, partial [Perkinsus olseni]
SGTLDWATAVSITDALCDTLSQVVRDCLGLQKRVRRTQGSAVVRAELRAASRDLRKLKRRCCYEHAKATLSKMEDPRKALAFHKKWCESAKRQHIPILEQKIWQPRSSPRKRRTSRSTLRRGSDFINNLMR